MPFNISSNFDCNLEYFHTDYLIATSQFVKVDIVYLLEMSSEKAHYAFFYIYPLFKCFRENCRGEKNHRGNVAGGNDMDSKTFQEINIYLMYGGKYFIEFRKTCKASKTGV